MSDAVQGTMWIFLGGWAVGVLTMGSVFVYLRGSLAVDEAVERRPCPHCGKGVS